MKTLKKMLSHLNWSNELILETLQKQDDKEARRLFVHILCAERVWLARLKEKENSSQLPIWLDELSLQACRTFATENELEISRFLNELTTSDLDRVVTYKNSKGIEFSNTTREILTHLALHGQYHRGQINLQLRKDGFEPINVDYITFVR